MAEKPFYILALLAGCVVLMCLGLGRLYCTGGGDNPAVCGGGETAI